MIGNNNKKAALTKIALLALNGMSAEEKQKVAERCGVSVYTFYRWMATNSRGLKNVEVIEALKEVGLTQDQIIEPVPVC